MILQLLFFDNNSSLERLILRADDLSPPHLLCRVGAQFIYTWMTNFEYLKQPQPLYWYES